jgi:hypothetical protein
MSNKIKQVCIYCASSSDIATHFFEATRDLTHLLVEQNIGIVFGGGAKGLMGQVADTVIAEGGRIKGIMPQFMKDVEWAHNDVQDFEFTLTMHQRKAKLVENVDAIIALPGGCGTLEELLEAITWKRLGHLHQPIVILNTNGYYDPLKLMLERSIDEGFMTAQHLQLWQFVEKPSEVLTAIGL